MDERLALAIGARVRVARVANHQPRVVVAGLSGITTDYLYQIERGKKLPTIPVLAQFAQLLNAIEAALGAAARRPQQRHSLASAEHECDDENLRRVFDGLRSWYKAFLEREHNALETVPKSQRFSDYLLERVSEAQKSPDSCLSAKPR
ncbi:MAG: helix-turn-helix domain-containing protein [Pseudonocardiaceae bacterium]